MAKYHIGEILIREGLITSEQLKNAIEEQRRTGQRLGRVLIDKGYVKEDALLKVLGTQLDSMIINTGATHKKVNKYLALVLGIQSLNIILLIGMFLFIRKYLTGGLTFLVDDEMVSYLSLFIVGCIVLFILFSFIIQQIYRLNNKEEL
ncbi:MAG: hypothetical protein ABH873_01630 [Candidatus Firestonebacteria bacterium]